MRKRTLVGTVAAVIAAGAVVLYAYQRWGDSGSNARNDVLGQMPPDAGAVLFLDVDALRQSPFLAELYKWAPQPKADPDYSQFLQSTGFNYERDLHRVSVALLKRGRNSQLFVVADGRFDQRKIAAYLSPSGVHENQGGREILSVPLTGRAGRITFTFLRNDRIALTNGDGLEALLSAKPGGANSDSEAWRERFRRLAGSPVFAVVRQDAAAGAALSAQAPGGLRSPQLSVLIDQLPWITIAGKPEADRMRIVLEGEGAADTNTRQLSDVLNGLLVLAEAGLSDQKMRRQLPPEAREAYLELLKSADVSQIDRGEAKSVRLIFDLTPRFLEAARTAMPVAPAAPENKTLPNKGTIRN
jgi:hypothetical protein